MGAPIRTSSDIPDFSTYPSSPSDQMLSAHAARQTPVFDAKSDAANPLHQVAKEVGSRLGEGMNAVQCMRNEALDRIDSVRSSMDALYCTLRDRATGVAQEKFDLLRGESQVQLRRAKQYAEARPLAVIAAAGIAGVLIGAGVRAWRGNRG